MGATEPYRTAGVLSGSGDRPAPHLALRPNVRPAISSERALHAARAPRGPETPAPPPVPGGNRRAQPSALR